MGTESIQTLAEICSYWARKAPDRTAIVAGDQEWTFGRVEEDAKRVAQGLASAGVGAGDRVAFLDKNVPEYFPQLFGGAKLNSVSVAVNWRLAPPEMEFIINNSEAKVLFVGPEFLDHIAKIELTTVDLIIVNGDPGSTGHQSFEAWMAGLEPADVDVKIGAEDTCYQLYTSGTTGLPKGVEITNANFLHTMSVGADNWGLHEEATNLVAMPLFHIAGSGWAVAGWYCGARTILAREVNPMEIIELIPQHGISHALLVPAVLQFILAVPGSTEADFSTMEAVTYGASPITEAVLAGSIALFDCKFIQAYGLTETTGGVVQLDPEDHDPGGERAHLLRSAGKPWGDVELRIVDAISLEDMADGEVGEVWVKTAQNMKGYWKNPEATAAAFTEPGWFRTGDAGYMREGYLYIHDRVKDMIVSGGENIYPAEIENALMKHPSIADIAAIGVPDDKWGETVKAVVVAAGDGELSGDEVIAFAKENLASYKCPTSVDFVEALPRNPSGKILKTELRAPYWQGRERLVN